MPAELSLRWQRAAANSLRTWGVDNAQASLIGPNEHRVSVSGTLSVAGFDDSPAATQIWSALTIIRQPLAAIAYHATKPPIANIAGEPPSQEMFDCHLVARSSMARPARFA